MSIQKSFFGKAGDQEVSMYTLSSGNLEVQIIEYGACIKSIYTKDKYGKLKNTVLGYDTLEEYMTKTAFLGAVCGRHANRIEGARVTINGVTYNLEKNEGENSLHSGAHGFHSRVFDGKIIGETLELSLVSPHLDQGFPGIMNLTVIYSITPDNGLLIEYRALSDRDTICNLTNHAYFNLEGDEGTILDHTIEMASDFYTPLKTGCLPNGEIRGVRNTPFDFTSARRIGDSIEAHEPLDGDGYDHNFVLRGPSDEPCVTLCAPNSGICMEVYTTLPGIQFYTGNFLDGFFVRDGKMEGKHHGLCLETQYFPNAMKYSHFLQPILKAGESMTSTTEYRFSLK